MTAIYAARESVLALVIERFVEQFDFSSLAPAQRGTALWEVGLLRPTVGHNNPRLAAALKRFEDRLRLTKAKGGRNGRDSKRLNRLLRWLVPLAMSAAAAGTIGAAPAFATHGTLAVGANVFNPLTQLNETVVEVIGSGYAVRTNLNHIIFLATTVNDTYSITSGGVTTAYTVTAVTTTTYGSGGSAVTYVTGITSKDAANVSTTFAVVNDATYVLPPAGGGAGSGSSIPSFPIPAGNEQYQDIRVGTNGGDGRDGGGINICIPFTSICAFVGVPPTAGGAGATGPTFTSTVDASYSGGSINSSAADLAGIKIASVGGNGGTGGDSYSIGGYAGQPGGAAGNGGDVTGNNNVTVSTSGANSHGMWVFSQAGSGGSGGSGYIFVGGGSGGGAASGGSATGNNYASITTQGTGAVGLLVQSLGGAGGSGGSSYGIVGSAGSGSIGGNGGTATAYNAGTILTGGAFGHGVEAQSIGGNGGNSGNAAGLVAFGAAAGGAGTGGNATINLAGTSDITTTGNFAHGAFAQSVGGGGGSSGWAGGVASFGGSGGSGGTGGTATVNASAGSQIETFGIGAYGIFAESVGGNGGTAAGTGGAFTMGGSGGSGNTGGTVNVSNSGSIFTHSQDARGILAQSVGGGGGNANVSGGVVSLGGSGGSGANGGAVTVTLGSASTISTLGKGADGVFAQSVGGGGGTGGTSAGLVALGGSGSVGGAGGAVSATNAGGISTDGAFARGLFAQSIGGGGGSGGDGYGLASIGGSGSVASNGGTVTIGNSGSISTTKNMSTAMQGQSIGGGGGDGGTSGGVLLSIGGSGAGGGAGGVVTANLSGSLETDGNDSHGLFAQSVGGGGGNGGSATSVSAFVGLALGGAGGGGGVGGNVTANFTQRSIIVGGSPLLVNPLITTTGDRSRGVFLQSVGGGGGSGGMAVQVSAGLFAAASFAIGGSAGNGGQGGVVQANGDVLVSTTGDYSEGFFAQSVGGGGGNGGAAVSVAASVGEGVSAALSVGIGGSGGLGGAGGTLGIASGGGIATSGAFSTGFVAQSVGGGGGKGGFSVSVAGAASDGIAVSGGLGIGGSGGSGGLGGTVNASFNGDIATGGLDSLGHDSAGALIQSIGGGGGVGGFNVSATIGLAGGTAVGAAVGLGGSGGSGGIGGTVTGSVGGDVTTRGARSTGVLIQSAGGGGGSGGFNISGNIGFSGGLAGGAAVGLGGTGGGGGTGGTVTGSALGQVETFAAQSDGVVIQSVGGGGGSGGFNVSGNLQFGGATAVAIGVGLGGSGGGAGAGGAVTGTAGDSVTTHGDQSRGVLVQSVGGGGGAGAFNITGGLAAGGVAGGTIGVGLGGNAGGGGGANTVNASAQSVTTSGNDSAGFIAQSVGGGGGVGGFNVTGGLGFGGTAGGTIGIGLGGSGGSGGSAMKVTAGLTGVATTGGDRSGAILAQSVGGGGGAGSFNISAGIAAAGTGAGSLNIGLGGTGGTAGNGGEVALTVVGHAITDGVESDGIVAQSVGGGGGTGGFNISAGIAAAGTGAGQVGFGMGGRGGGGGNAELVTLNVNNGVTTSDLYRIASITQQNLSSGIVAQSLGGGGGNGGFNVTGGASFAGTGAGGVNVGIGGSGGAGGLARNVIADISGYTSTGGNDSIGVLAQSVGGGGGNGNFNISGGLTIAGTGSGMINVGVGGGGGSGGRSGDVTLRINDQILAPSQLLVAAVTAGDRSSGVIAQSLGGGGGNGGFNVTGGINLAGTGTGGANIGVGGMGGNGGLAGNAAADITGGIATAGEFSNALVVQSIGGGGGNGGFNVSGTLSISKNAGALSVGIGGFGGDGGAAGTALLNLNQRTTDAGNTLAAVSTSENDSGGIVVQSLGGGGGNGGFNVAGSMSFASGGAGNLGVGVGGFGGGGGDAAIATANVRGDIVTDGDRSGGLLVQSLGGGGGNGGFNVTGGIAGSKGGNGNIGIGVGGFGGDGGDGKAVFATIQSDIQTGGDDSYGVNIQSLGGGGGNGGFNITGGISASFGTIASGNFGIGIGGFGGGGGGGDTVTASLTGNVVTSGANSHGILIQSAGGGGGSGGFNVTGNISVSKGANGSVGIGIGGFGGDGGGGGIVNATLNGNVSTDGIKSYGALLQSVGGAGGAGGLDVSGNLSISVSSGTSVAASLGLGGFGGAGGDGKAVTGSVTGRYVTLKDSSAGVIAQSVGGGGGQGGINVSGAIAFSPGEAGTGSIGIGGFGGGGGNAGIVTFTRLGDTSTSGANSDGVVVQSVGGGGGAGGINVSGGIAAAKGTTAALGFGLGGFGGGGGYGEAVTANVDGNVHATGIASDTIFPTVIVGQILGFGGDIIQEHRERLGGSNGVLVQSVGGGGGSGGLNVTGEIAFTKSADDPGRAASIGVGGFGGSGGDAGTATLYLGTLGHYEIVANGDGKDAVAVQSIGGGGGQGGVNVSGAISTEGQLVVGVGGFGGDGGISKAVYASVNADLWAAGNNSIGLLAQSVGGGGGQGGLNVSAGIVLSSGTKDPSVVFGLGGFGGVGNHADRVDVVQLGQIIVEGANATGVLVQSVGGGGGAGALNVSTSLSRATGEGKLDGIALAAGVGGTGGLGADAGNVTLDSNGLILVNSVVTVNDGVTTLTSADYAKNAAGILVQSVGGGGGSGGINVSAAVAPKGAPMSVAVGGSGGAGGDAGTVTVTRGYTMVGGVETKTGSLINTFGDGSAGLIAQSIGGGGGNAGFNLGLAINKVPEDQSKIAANFAIGGDGGDAGEGKAVTVRHNGDIATHGGGSDGILAQSITKGGGNGNYNIGGGYTGNSSSLVFKLGGTGGNGGRAGDVTVAHEGIIETDGNNSAGIRAQSIGKGGGNSSTELGSNYGSSNTLNVQIGATGGAGGIAGNVTIDAAGFITTRQGNSDGIAAQSIGGGGGSSGSIVVQGQVSSGTGKDKKANSVGVALGLEGGEGGVAGMVDVSSSAEIRTLGDMSRGIFAQSLGGDGGTGGSATGTIVGAANGASLAIGGGGGSGAIANRVHVDQSGLIVTTGSQSDGILAQSVGGGGGAGGMASSYVIQKQAGTDGESANTVSVAVGGGGGSAGTGGNVDVLNSGTIATTGDFGYGIRAQSIGGGGGVGGAVLSALMQGKSASNELSVLVGGAGGDGNTAGSVDVTNHGLIYTTGANAAGISANSIGGGGGDAGVILSLQLSLFSEGETHRLDFAIGGNGGTGGTGGEVTVTNASTGGVNSGTIATTGQDSYGILAQSIGGGGGNSSSIVTISASRGDKESSSLGINFGARGGDGNSGGTVNVTNGSLIQTGGAGAHGVLAQSVGGGGGNGGLVLAGSLILKAPTASPLISLGGVGGTGGDGGNVFVTNSGQILTTGAKANGILAQSIGGGGGNSSMGFSATGEPGSLILGNAISALMGALGGGSGGTGGNVTVVHTGDITVTGSESQAILAQSINGGGGSLDLNFDGISSLPGFAYGGSTADGGHVDPLMVINAGGDGSNGMNAGNVSVTSNGTIGVGGKNAVAISLQAIGGGGGTINLHGLIVQRPQDIEPGSDQQAVRVAATLGGKNGADNDGGNIDGVQTGTITTFSDGTAGLELQSIGGGGGKVLIDMESEDLALLDGAAISLGATGEVGSQGGAIDRQQSGLIQTLGDFAPGAVIQSIGGGGGIANISFAQIQPAPVAPAAGGVQHLAIVSSQSAGGLTNLSLGSSGGSGNDGGAIVQALSGGAITSGNHSPALLLQSIGAGGGFASIAGDSAPTISLGGVNGAQGTGGAVTLLNNGLIATAGIGSHGVILQSIGGGGGAVFGDFSTANITLNSANGGNGGIITFSQNGDIVVIGDQATALIAQSLGGGGGFVDGVFAGTAGGVGRGGEIGLDVDGGIIAYGLNSTAVMAQSLGSLGGSNITIGATGDVRGGSGSGVGIALDGGANNLVTIESSLSAVSGRAMTGTYGNDRLENDGLTVGNILLGGGNNLVHTAIGATFLTIDTLDLRDGLGSTGLFDNDGNLEMGLAATLVPIDLLNGETFALPVITNPKTDLLVGTSVISHVALDGNFRQSASGLMNYDVAFGPYASDRIDATGSAVVDGTAHITLTWLENNHPVTLISTGAGGTDLGLDPVDTIAIDYGILASSAGIHLTLATDFAQDFLNYNQQQIGLNLDSSVAVGGASGIGRLLALIGNLTAGQEDIYADIFAELDPESLLAPTIVQLDSARDFGTGVVGCQPGDERGAKCVFGRVDGHRLDSKGGEMDVDFAASARLRLGGAVSAGNGWRVGGSLGFDDVGNLEADNSRTKGTGGFGFHAGLGIGKLFAGDRGEASLALTLGSQHYATERFQNIFEPGVGHATIRTRYVGANAGLGFTLSSGTLFATPAIDLQAIRMTIGDFAESGLDGTGARSDGTSDWYLSATPKLTAGVKSGAIKLSGTVGYQLSDKGQIVAPIRLIGSPDASDPAMIRTLIDKEMLMLGANVEVQANSNAALQFGFKGLYGDRVKSESANVKLVVRF